MFLEKNNSRSSLLAKNIFASFLVKGWSAIVVLLMVPLTLKMLGIYTNGVWLTISSILMWIDLMDIGLGNGLRNAVAKHVAMNNNEKVRQDISSTFFMLFVIIIPLLFIFYFIICCCDMYSMLGIDRGRIQHLNKILVVATTLASSTFIFKSVGNFYMGMQLPAVNNLIVCLGQTTAMVLTYIAYMEGCHSLFAVVIINTAAPLSLWLLSIPYTFGVKYPQYCPSFRCVDLGVSKSLFSAGVQFFIIQVCGVILFMSTNIIISRLFSPAEVTPYQIAYRYFNMAIVIFTIVCMPFWNATTDAYTRGDLQWIHKAGKRLDFLVFLSFIGLTIMVAISNFVYEIWVGSEVTIPIEMSASMALYLFVLIASMRYSYILNGVNVLRIQLIYTISATIVFLPLAYVACDVFPSVTTLILVMCIVNIPGLIANAWKYYQIFYNKSQ